MPETTAIELPESFVGGVYNSSPASGLTHGFYRYPARFSPAFARTAIEAFSEPGDVVLDPFMGSGTTLVEAMAAGRNAIGSDISTLAHFVSLTKTTVMAEEAVAAVLEWANEIQARLNLHLPAKRAEQWLDLGYQKYLPWPVRKTLEFALVEVETLPTEDQRRFARCGLLRTAQWAVDCTTRVPRAKEFRSKLVEVLKESARGMEELRRTLVELQDSAPSAVCLSGPASTLDTAMWQDRIQGKPKLVVTSPPYPKVHVVYHRWQVNGRRETPAPFWIANSLDGKGLSHYTMGSRTPTGLNNYFRAITDSFARVHALLADDAVVVQLIAFTDVEEQLPRYLASMAEAGFREVGREGAVVPEDRLWRDVPLRKWYASLQGKTSSSRELLLIHQRVG